jgi:hypothetical protein
MIHLGFEHLQSIGKVDDAEGRVEMHCRRNIVSSWRKFKARANWLTIPPFVPCLFI